MRSLLVLFVMRRSKHSVMCKGFQKVAHFPERYNRSAQVDLLQKRLAEYERELKNQATDRKSNIYTSDSIMAESLIKKDCQYEKVIKRRNLDKVTEPSSSTVAAAGAVCELPLAAEPLSEKVISSSTTMISDSISEGPIAGISGDRGYYVEGDAYVDDYILGSTTDFPEEEMTVSTRQYFGPDDALEHIDFQLPGQSTEQDTDVDHDYYAEVSSEDVESYGTINPARAAIDRNCSGCGAQLHCKDSSLPGFLPEELLDKAARGESDSILCRRCHLLKHHNFLLNVNVCPVDYEATMSCLRLNPEALVLLVVDITDVPGSIHKELPRIIGSRRPMIVIANKVDLLPPDARCGYLKRFKRVVEEEIERVGFREEFYLLHTALVSAKTGYGIEDLITQIHVNYTTVKDSVRNDIFLVGCTNAGKSSLFNALLQSDLCKVQAVDLVERATTSVWPGTTLSLLKFPIMKPSPYRMELRRRRLLQNRAWLQKEMYRRKLMLQRTGDPNYAVLIGTIQNTFKERDDDLRPVALKNLMTHSVGEQEPERLRKWSPRDPVFAKGMWCYDTPGTVNEQQVLNLFTLDELIHVLPRRLLQPRTALVPVGYSLLIGGVARIDVLKSAKHSSVLLTTFASDDLPLNCMRTEEVESFFEENLGSKALVVPCGVDRLERWPKMEGKYFELRGKKEGGIADVVLSSIGWVMLTSASAHVQVRAYTPGGRGLTTRSPLLPYSADVRGKRIPGTRFYKVKPIEFPINLLRQKARKRWSLGKSDVSI